MTDNMVSQKTQFAQYIENYQNMLQQQTAFIGTIHINPGYQSAYVETEQNGIYQIPDKIFINRAMDGDRVVIMILGEQVEEREYAQWSLTNQQNTDNISNISKSFATVINVIERKQTVYNLDCIISAQSSFQKQTLIFQPLNHLYPLIECANNVFIPFERNQIVEVQIDIQDWVKQLVYPPGQILKYKDQMASFALQSAGINYNYKNELQQDDEAYKLIQDLNNQFCEELNLDHQHVFVTTQDSLNNIDKYVNHVKQNIKDPNRMDLTDQTVFTIDPDTAKDFDDACSVNVKCINGKTYTAYEYCQLTEQLEIQSYIIQVHIADVTYFTDLAGENNILIRNAQQTTTSIYFADRCCPMYPYELADGLASLNPGVPRYVFTVIFEIDKDGYLLPQTVKFTKGVIISRCRLDYVAAQKIIDKQKLDLTQTTIEGWPVCKTYHKSIIFSTQVLNQLALKLRHQRETVGSLQINNSEIRYGITSDLNVTIREPEEAPQAHHLIEEFMILTNCLVSMRLMQTFVCCPVLRQHSPPASQYPYNKQLQQLKCPPVDVQSPKKLITSLTKLKQKLQQLNQMINLKDYQAQNLANITFLSSSLVRACYICGMSQKEVELAHWGIHAQSYMHFTSPIRRYADDICHIMLNEALIWEREVQSQNQNSLAQNKVQNQILQKHYLKFNVKTNIYDNTVDFFPQGYMRRISSELYPVTSNIKQDPEHQENTNLLDLVEGNDNLLKFNIRDNMKLKQKFQQMIQKAAQGEDVREIFKDNKKEKKEFQIDKDSEEYKLIVEINDRLQQRLKLPIQMIKTLMARCNTMNIQAENACQIHQQIKYGNKLETCCFLVKIDKQCVFYIPQYDISFTLQNKSYGQNEQQADDKILFKINKQEPLNKQMNEGNDYLEASFLQPIRIIIKPANSPIDGIEIYKYQ